MLISTNIIRDQDLDFDYIVTDNAQRIFTELVEPNKTPGNCYNLIGSYGTGKSSFLVALEQSISGKKSFFKSKKRQKNIGFLKLIGKPQSIKHALTEALEMNPKSDVEAIQSKLTELATKHTKLYILVDELGKFVEYALNNNPKVETYVFQRLAEFINDPKSNICWVGTLHQNIDSYASNASAADSMEWEKVSGRFLTLNFNEPPTTLLKLISSRLGAIEARGKSSSIKAANKIIADAKLIPDSFIQLAQEELQSIAPFDGLSSFLTISLLQKYGQNERSVFSFLSAKGTGTIASFGHSFFSPADLVDYAVDRLAHVVFSNSNPDKLLWEAAERSIQRADAHKEIHPAFARVAIRTILLTNIFGREGSSFNTKALEKYLVAVCGKESKQTIEQLLDKNIIQFLKHRGKVVFVEGTDVNIQNELRIATKHLSNEVNLCDEIVNRIVLAPALSRGHFIRSGAPRFMHFVLHGRSENTKQIARLGNGTCHVLLDSRLSLELPNTEFPEVIVQVGTTELLEQLMREVLLYEWILEKYSDDLVVKQLVTHERDHVLNQLIQSLKDALTAGDARWIDSSGTPETISSERQLNNFFQRTFNDAYRACPQIHNELINQGKLSTSVNTSRKVLMAALENRSVSPGLGFSEERFPAQKSIFLSTWIQEKMYNRENGTLSGPDKSSTYAAAWNACEAFLDEAQQGKVNLLNLYEELQRQPFGMKLGLLNYWIPLFLLTKEDEFALYYAPEDKYLPYLSVDIFESLNKKPQDFVLKKFNFQGVSHATLNQYRELASIDQSRTEARSTYLGIFTNFILLQRNLNRYGQQTKTMSKEGIALREAIGNAPDPETALFETIPSAIGFHQIAATENPEVVTAYFEKLRDTAREIASTYENLLDRLEQTIQKAFGIGAKSFEETQDETRNLLKGVDVILLQPQLRAIYERLKSPLDDRESWVKSVADAVLGQSLENLNDDNEPKLHKNLQEAIEALIAHKGLLEHPDSVAVSITTPTGEHLKRFVPQLEDAPELQSKLAQRLEGLSADERMQLVSLILETENSSIAWE